MSDSTGVADQVFRDDRWLPIAQILTTVVTDCDHAGVTLAIGGAVHGVACSPVGHRADQLQHELSQGPVLEALCSREVIISRRLDHDHRWPRWTLSAVRDLGLASALALPHDLRGDGTVVLSLYSDRPDAWCRSTVEVAQALAPTVLRLASDAMEISHLRRGLTTRSMIGQALGMVRERYGLEADDAFGYLRRLSQETNRKLSVIASEIVAGQHTTGAILPTDPSDTGQDA